MEHAGRAEGWARRARMLVEAGDDAPLVDLVRAVDVGVALRRHSMRSGPQSDPAGSVAEPWLARLQAAELARLTAETGGLAAPAAIRASTEKRLHAERAELERLLISADLDAVTRCTLLGRFRLDLLELGERVAWLDGSQHCGHPSNSAQFELKRVRQDVESVEARPLRPQRLRLIDSWRRTYRRLLVHRLDRLLTPPVAPSDSPEAHWRRRFQLTRMRAELIEEIGPARVAPPDEEGDELLDHLLPGVDERRDQLARSVVELVGHLPPAVRLDRLDGLVHLARGEAQEVLALAEDAPPARAIPLLDGMVADLQHLASDVRLAAGLPETAAVPLAAARLRAESKGLLRLARTLRGEWQEKDLAQRMDHFFGPRFKDILDGLVLVLILVLTALIAAEGWLEFTGRLDQDGLAWFAWADLIVCCFFLAEFALKWGLSRRRWLYFKRHALIDLLPSIPFGFIAFRFTASPALEGIQLLRLLRIPRLIRLLRLARPVVRGLRLVIFFFRFVDRLVRRYASVFNRNIILFEPSPERDSESSARHLFVGLRRQVDRRAAEAEAALDPAERLEVAARMLGYLSDWIGWQPVRPLQPERPPRAERDITAERAVERLIEMTPDEILESMGPNFVASVDRLIQLVDLPLIRGLPVIRELVAHREQGAAESTALAANYLGYAILRGLDWVYFVADLQATVSPPLFLDKLGRTIVNATRRPAFRLLTFGLLFAGLWGTINAAIPKPPPNRVGWLGQAGGALHDLAQGTAARLGPTVVVLGAICLVLFLIGQWLRRIANQAAEFCERIVEAQFSTQTKDLKRKSRGRDLAFIAARVTRPELTLRASDDLAEADAAERVEVDFGTEAGPDAPSLKASESSFLHNLNLLYSDFLDGPPFHRTDTKASTQLLGNLALRNLSRSSLSYLLREERRLQRLDLSRAASSVFGGPYLWFDYIIRLIVQQTATLLVDYNRHAVPLDRLACSPEPVRERFRAWLAGRLGIPESQVEVPPPVGRIATEPAPPGPRLRAEADEFFETVEFTAVDFLGSDPARDEALRERFGPQLVALLARDRERNLRQAFRSFPLHRAPISRRTINPYYLYEAFFAKGRVVLLPFRLAWMTSRAAVFLAGRLVGVIRQILEPTVDTEADHSDDNYASALRKIHRMRKPAFMESLWMRARFDVEYLGVALPGVAGDLATESLLEADLDFIGASRHERVMAGRLRDARRTRVRRVSVWLRELGWSGPGLVEMLRADLPILADRSAEVVRAMVAACVVDHDDLYSLGSSIEGLRKLFAYAARPGVDLRSAPEDLPEPIVSTRLLWHPSPRRRRKLQQLLDLPCFRRYSPEETRRIARALRRHSGISRGWIRVLLSQGGPDPIDTLRRRLLHVALRTELWSEQIIVLRMVQTLTMLDLQHYAELVWRLGGYEALGDASTLPELPLRQAAAERGPAVEELV